MSDNDKNTMKVYDEYLTKIAKANNDKANDAWMATSKPVEREDPAWNTGSSRYSTAGRDEEVGSHGPIMSKYPSIIFARCIWRDRYWAKVGSSSIYLLKDKTEFDVWKQSKNLKFVHKKINFDMVDMLRTQPSALRKKNGPPRFCKYRMRDVTANRTKTRTKTPLDGSSFKLMMHTTEAGTFEAAGFSSHDGSQEVDALRTAMVECMEACIQKYNRAAH
jgi:hypothetical protein